MNYNSELSVYRWAAFALTFLIILVLASGGLSVIWLRQKISHTAARNTQLEMSIVEIERKSARLDEQLAKLHNPIYLMSRAKNGLRPTDERNQVVWMAPVENHEQQDEQPIRSNTPLGISFDLALMDPHQGSRQTQ